MFQGFPDTTRIWIYQSNRPFSEKEKTVLQSQLHAFAQSWTAHSLPLSAAAALLYDRFLVLAVDENKERASGCSIDSSVSFIKSIEQQYNIQLFDRLLFAFKNGDEVQSVPRPIFAQLYKDGKINDTTLVFDNMVNTLGDLRQNWLKPLAQSWHKRMVS